MRLLPRLFLLLSILLIVSPSMAAMTQVFNSTDTVIVNSTSTMSESTGAPYDLWVYSIIITALILLISFFQFPKGEEGLIAVMAIFTSGYALFSASNVDRIVGTGLQVSGTTMVFMEKHVIYNFGNLYVYLIPLFIFSLANPVRIWMNMRAMKQIATVDQEDAPSEENL
jgi:hypothetical protein